MPRPSQTFKWLPFSRSWDSFKDKMKYSEPIKLIMIQYYGMIQLEEEL